jgi:hypothetical protein
LGIGALATLQFIPLGSINLTPNSVAKSFPYTTKKEDFKNPDEQKEKPDNDDFSRKKVQVQ